MTINRRPVSVERLEKMGQLMKSKNEATVESLGEEAPQYGAVKSEHFAIVKRKDGDRVVYIVASPLMTNGKKDISFCHEVLDPTFAHYAYPLMESQLKQDLGTLRDFLSVSPKRSEMYKAFTRVAPAAKLDDLVSVRAILWAEENKSPINEKGAKQALDAVTRDFTPSFEFKLNPQEKAHLKASKQVVI